MQSYILEQTAYVHLSQNKNSEIHLTILFFKVFFQMYV